jgi:hypothetical protein
MVLKRIKERLEAGVVMEAAVKGADERVIGLKILTSKRGERKSEFCVGIRRTGNIDVCHSDTFLSNKPPTPQLAGVIWAVKVLANPGKMRLLRISLAEQ